MDANSQQNDEDQNTRGAVEYNQRLSTLINVLQRILWGLCFDGGDNSPPMRYLEAETIYKKVLTSLVNNPNQIFPVVLQEQLEFLSRFKPVNQRKVQDRGGPDMELTIKSKEKAFQSLDHFTRYLNRKQVNGSGIQIVDITLDGVMYIQAVWTGENPSKELKITLEMEAVVNKVFYETEVALSHLGKDASAAMECAKKSLLVQNDRGKLTIGVKAIACGLLPQSLCSNCKNHFSVDMTKCHACNLSICGNCFHTTNRNDNERVCIYCNSHMSSSPSPNSVQRRGSSANDQNQSQTNTTVNDEHLHRLSVKYDDSTCTDNKFEFTSIASKNESTGHHRSSIGNVSPELREEFKNVVFDIDFDDDNDS